MSLLGNPFDGLKHKIESSLNHLGDSIKSGITHLGDTVENTIKSTEGTALAAIKKAVSDAVANIKKETSDALAEIKKSEDGVVHLSDEIAAKIKSGETTIQDELAKLPQEAKDAVMAVLEEDLKLAIKKLKSFLSDVKEDLDEFAKSDPELVKEINAVEDSFQVSFLVLTYTDLYSSLQSLISELESLTSGDFKFTQKTVSELSNSTGIKRVGLDLNGMVDLIIASSTDFGVADTVSFPVRLGVLSVNKILSKMGLPKS